MIPKQTRNSRGLKIGPGALKRYPTHEALIEAMENGTFFFDLFLNPEGVAQAGDPLNKATLLKNSTAALYGKGADAVPDEILAAIRPMITAAQNSADVRARFSTGSYVGTEMGAAASKTLSFDFDPVILIIAHSSVYNGANFGHFLLALRGTSYAASVSASDDTTGGLTIGGQANRVIFSGKTVTVEHMNDKGTTYQYAAIG